MPNKKAFIAVLIGLGLILVVGRPFVVSLDNDQKRQEVASAEVAVSPDSVLLSSLERDLDFYRQLSIGDRFALQLGADNADAIAEVLVSKVDREGVIASIEGSLPAKGSLLMTVGDKFIHVFKKKFPLVWNIQLPQSSRLHNQQLLVVHQQ